MSAPLLLDASVWLAALDADDHAHESARTILEASAGDEVALAALDLTLYEIANVAVVRWRSSADAERLVALVLVACPDTLLRVDEGLVRAAAAIATSDRLTVHDAAYVAAARERLDARQRRPRRSRTARARDRARSRNAMAGGITSSGARPRGAAARQR